MPRGSFTNFDRSRSGSRGGSRVSRQRARRHRGVGALTAALAIGAIAFVPVAPAHAQTQPLKSLEHSVLIIVDSSPEHIVQGLAETIPMEANGHAWYAALATIVNQHSTVNPLPAYPEFESFGSIEAFFDAANKWRAANGVTYETVKGVVVTFSSSPGVTFSAPSCSTNVEGTCGVRITSTVPGDYSIHVRVDGIEIPNSPTSVSFAPPGR